MQVAVENKPVPKKEFNPQPAGQTADGAQATLPTVHSRCGEQPGLDTPPLPATAAAAAAALTVAQAPSQPQIVSASSSAVSDNAKPADKGARPDSSIRQLIVPHLMSCINSGLDLRDFPAAVVAVPEAVGGPTRLVPVPASKVEADADADALVANAIYDAILLATANIELPAAALPQLDPAEQEALEGKEFGLRSGITVDLARFGKDPLVLQDRLEKRILNSPSPVTSLVLVLSTLHAARTRQLPFDAIHRNLLNFTLLGLPPEKRLEALVAFRSMLGGEASNPLAQTSLQEIRNRYAKLGSAAKTARLQEWAQMKWWDQAAANLTGHTEPMRIRAVEGLLAILAPRLSAQDADCQRKCLTDLFKHIQPVKGETLVAEHLQAVINAWCEIVIKLDLTDFNRVMLDQVWPVVMSDLEDREPQATVLLMALEQCLCAFARDSKHSRQAILNELGHWFSVLVPSVIKLGDSSPKQALSLTLRIIPLIREVRAPWAKMQEKDLRAVINAGPDSKAKTMRNDQDSECKTQ